jgi:hypothetical protein
MLCMLGEAIILVSCEESILCLLVDTGRGTTRVSCWLPFSSAKRAQWKTGSMPEQGYELPFTQVRTAAFTP